MLNKKTIFIDKSNKVGDKHSQIILIVFYLLKLFLAKKKNYLPKQTTGRFTIGAPVLSYLKFKINICFISS